jgi:hypothetical protein
VLTFNPIKEGQTVKLGGADAKGEGKSGGKKGKKP